MFSGDTVLIMVEGIFKLGTWSLAIIGEISTSSVGDKAANGPISNLMECKSPDILFDLILG